MTTIAPDRPLLNVYKAAARLAVSEKTIRRLIRKGELSAFRVGGSPRLDPDELEQWLNARRTQP
jgi:excisionase family DNA binding protein